MRPIGPQMAELFVGVKDDLEMSRVDPIAAGWANRFDDYWCNLLAAR